MRILYISYLCQPSNKIGAVRPTNMSRYLAEFGHEVTVLTNNDSVTKECGRADVRFVPHSRLILSGQERIRNVVTARREAGIKSQGYAVPTAEEKKQGLFNKKAFRLFRLWCWDWLQQADWARACRHYCRKNLKKDYDVVLSCYGPLGSLLAGRWAGRRKYAPVWISDMRDPIANDMMGKAVFRYSRRLEKQMLRRADHVVCVSNGQRSWFLSADPGRDHGDKITVIENGYEAAAAPDSAAEDGVLRIAYTGMLYTGRRDFTVLMNAVKKLTEEGSIPEGSIEIHYAGPQGIEFMDCAQKAEAERFSVNHGMLPRAEAMILQQQADVLCVLSWNTEKSRGVLPGKFWEYLRTGKPVLSIVSGEVPHAELTEFVKKMELGFAYEEVSGEEDGPALEKWLKEAVDSKKENGRVIFEPRRNLVEDYRYDNRSRRMEEVCLRTVKPDRASAD